MDEEPIELQSWEELCSNKAALTRIVILTQEEAPVLHQGYNSLLSMVDILTDVTWDIRCAR